jgi:hypothetical protein
VRRVEAFQLGRGSDAYAAGLTRAQLRSQRFVRPARDAYAVATSLDTLGDLCRTLQVVLPSAAAFCLATAARLLGLPLPFRFDDRIHVAVPAGEVVPHRPQLVGHALILPKQHVSLVAGLPVTCAARTFLDLAGLLDLDSLIALGDAALHMRLTTTDELSSVVATASRRRGVIRAREAAPRLDARAESPPESMARVWAQEAGLPEVTPQAVIRDDCGHFVARVDLLFDEYKVVVEYEGRHHRDAQQYAADLARRNRLSALGYLVVHLDASTLHRALAVDVMANALCRRGWSRSG